LYFYISKEEEEKTKKKIDNLIFQSKWAMKRTRDISYWVCYPANIFLNERECKNKRKRKKKKPFSSCKEENFARTKWRKGRKKKREKTKKINVVFFSNLLMSKYAFSYFSLFFFFFFSVFDLPRGQRKDRIQNNEKRERWVESLEENILFSYSCMWISVLRKTRTRTRRVRTRVFSTVSLVLVHDVFMVAWYTC